MSGCQEVINFLDRDLSGAEISGGEVSADSDENEKLISHYIDVGQGDCEFIELPNGQTILIDAGTSKYGDKIADYIESSGYDEIDYLVATHPHADHIGGMKQIVEEFDIGTIYMPKATANTKTYENLLTAIADKGLTIKTAKAGVIIVEEDNLTVEIIAPVCEEYDDLNNYSAVIKITYEDSIFLYMGDAEELSENGITCEVSADVIKVGHHGSDSSSSQEFVDKVNPQYAVISVGEDNSYDHPSDDVVQRWLNTGAEVYRTDECGTIIISSDGEEIIVEAERGV